MILLTLNDGTAISVQGTSTPASIVVKGNTSAIAIALEKITTDNLKNATLGDTTLSNLIATGGSFSAVEDGEITAIFTTREKSELEILREEISEVQDALMELAE